MKNIIYTLLIPAIFGLIGCEKNDPIMELGDSSGEFSANISVSYNNTKPMIGDTVIATVSTWQRDDKFDKVVFYETIYESFGLDLKLNNGTIILTKDLVGTNNALYSTLILSDTIKRKAVWNTVSEIDLDKFWVTSTNNYVIRSEYELKRLDGKYPSDVSLINNLTNVDFAVLKSILAYNITRLDYEKLFPAATSDHFTTGGTYVLSAIGINNLKEHLSKDMLVAVTKSLDKTGTYNIIIDVDAITPTGTVTPAVSRKFENKI